ncbi:hypothetical protein PIIN_09238 [Serendipita indica DSM 11827]|uniref:Aminoglycoside phosphotransferase domain-containing protein n=1 Tax=Serendipita indica (strain DSM 11827) TaxID=1109443 RepID=G4TVB1_SERID|nr:hypothetical protein PIIN_09238 [Serendipita indica DSM 11827]
MFVIYDAIRRICPLETERESFHFACGDLRLTSILVDRETGKITGVIDREMAGFRPSWLCAVPGNWFDDDSNRFSMEGPQGDGPFGYDDNTPEDTGLREYFLSELKAHNPQLFEDNQHGAEFRAIFYTLCEDLGGNIQACIRAFRKFHWSEDQRRPFPFDYEQFRDLLWKLFHEERIYILPHRILLDSLWCRPASRLRHRRTSSRHPRPRAMENKFVKTEPTKCLLPHCGESLYEVRNPVCLQMLNSGGYTTTAPE